MLKYSKLIGSAAGGLAGLIVSFLPFMADAESALTTVIAISLGHLAGTYFSPKNKD